MLLYSSIYRKRTLTSDGVVHAPVRSPSTLRDCLCGGTFTFSLTVGVSSFKSIEGVSGTVLQTLIVAIHPAWVVYIDAICGILAQERVVEKGKH